MMAIAQSLGSPIPTGDMLPAEGSAPELPGGFAALLARLDLVSTPGRTRSSVPVAVAAPASPAAPADTADAPFTFTPNLVLPRFPGVTADAAPEDATNITAAAPLVEDDEDDSGPVPKGLEKVADALAAALAAVMAAAGKPIEAKPGWTVKTSPPGATGVSPINGAAAAQTQAPAPDQPAEAWAGMMQSRSGDAENAAAPAETESAAAPDAPANPATGPISATQPLAPPAIPIDQPIDRARHARPANSAPSVAAAAIAPALVLPPSLPAKGPKEPVEFTPTAQAATTTVPSPEQQARPIERLAEAAGTPAPLDHAAPLKDLATPAPAPILATAPAAPTPSAPPAQPLAPAEIMIDHHLDLARDGEWLDRLARDIARVAGNESRLRFQLNPEHLGSLGVDIANRAEGTTIRLTADSEAARTILTDAQPRLIAEARAQGLRISEAHIDLGSQPGQSGQQPRQQPSSPAAFIRTHEGHEEPAAEQSRPSAERYA